MRGRHMLLVNLLAALASGCCCMFGGSARSSELDAGAPVIAIAASSDVGSLRGRLRLSIPPDPDHFSEPERGPTLDGMLASEALYPEAAPEIELFLHELPCRAEGELGSAALRELALRRPEHASDADPVLLPGAIPMVALRPRRADAMLDASTWIASYVVVPDGHAIWVDATCRNTCDPAAARALADRVVASARRGPHPFRAPAGERLYGDLVETITVPEGWVSTHWVGGNEEPPYVSSFVETFEPLRPLGAPPRTQVIARSGTCAPGDGPVAGTMLGEAIRWTRTSEGLCWQQTHDADATYGTAWDVRGATPTELDEALRIAATARVPSID